MNSENEPTLALLPVRREFIDAYYLRLTDDYLNKRLNDEQLRGVFRLMLFGDERRNLWTIGMETGKWYTLKGDEWQLDNPPEVLFAATTDEAMKQATSESLEAIRAVLTELDQSKTDTDKDNVEGGQLCPRCGWGNPTGRLFCSNCGAELSRIRKVETIPEEPARTLSNIVCKSCGSVNAPEKRFCTQCGSQLGELGGGKQ
jgi:DNA-directed RNA polymerase subunit RPC12/RpoP